MVTLHLNSELKVVLNILEDANSLVYENTYTAQIACKTFPLVSGACEFEFSDSSRIIKTELYKLLSGGAHL